LIKTPLPQPGRMKRDWDDGLKAKGFQIYFIPEPTQRVGKMDIPLILKPLDGLGKNPFIQNHSPAPIKKKFLLKAIGTEV
jgi:hypothetical protein